MKILVDTHIFLWMLSYPEKLNEKRQYDLKSPANEIFLSAISIAELMIKHMIPFTMHLPRPTLRQPLKTEPESQKK